MSNHVIDLRAALLRLVLILVCLLVAWSALGQYRAWQRNRDQLLEVTADAELGSAAVTRRLQREITPNYARLEAARALVFQILERGGAAAGDELERLATARRLARTGLEQQPNSWQAAMLLGASTYLEWSQTRDPRLFTAADAWQKPLLKALEEAPHEHEPRRILAAAYLELWPALSPARKELARELLRTAFAEDPQAFELLGSIWLEVASDPSEALALVPDQPAAWQRLMNDYSAARRFELVCVSHERYLTSLERALAERLEEGETRLRLGDDFHSRTRFARVVADAPTELRFVPMVNRALARYPPGLISSVTDDAMRRWLRWVIELSEVGIYPLEPSIVRRLAVATQRLAPPDAALVSLIGDDLAGAERLERLDLDRVATTWAPYFVAKAHRLLDRGDSTSAAMALEQVAPAYRVNPTYWIARLAVAQARSDRVMIAEAEEELARRRRASWPANAWRHEPRRSVLYLLAAERARGVTIAVAESASGGAAVQLRWDGATVGCRVVRPGRLLKLDVPVSDGPHLLEWTTVGGSPAQPGAVALVLPP